VTSIQQKLSEALKRQGIKPTKAAEETPVQGQIVTVLLADIEGKEIQWFWPNRIPAGMLSLLVGNPGVGKSFLTMYICSRISTGSRWPDSENKTEPGSVLLFSDEESLEYAIKPRLDAHQADCTKIFAVPHIKKPDGNPDSFSIGEHIQLLREHLDRMPDCRLIIFDPITAYLGAVNANNNAEVRGALVGLQGLAQEKKVTILGINHFSKKVELDAIHRILGSTGFVAAARAVWAVIQERYEDDCQGEPGRLLVPVKSNYSIAPTALKFQIVDGQVVFEDGQHQVNIDAILQNAKNAKRNPNLGSATTFLSQKLEGKVFEYAKDIIDEAKEMGISKNILYKAKNKLGVSDWKDGFGSPVKWSLEGKPDSQPPSAAAIEANRI
jgi:RecA-family ATPase